MKSRVIKIICLIFTLIFTVSAFSWSALAGVLTNNPMKDTSVEEDLSKLGFDTSGYGLDTTADFVSIIDFVEYGYDAGGNQEYYGLFVYLYNPSGKEIRGAYLQMEYIKKDGSETGYKKYRLVEVDCNDESTVRPYTLYKFVVKDSADIVKNVPYAVRTYSVSGIEIKYSITDSSNAIDYAVSGKWIFSGYQENCGKKGDTTSTLSCKYEVEETIRTELHSANWFSATSDLGPDYRYEVSSVYFNIPNHYIDKYGDLNAETSGLVSVQGEYYKYVTNGLLVTDQTWYDRFSQFENADISLLPSYKDGTLSSKEYYGFFKTVRLMQTVICQLSYNVKHSGSVTSYNSLKRFANLLLSSSDVPYVNSQDLHDVIFQPNVHKYYYDTDYFVSENQMLFSDLGRQFYNISVDDNSLNEEIKSFAQSKGANWLHKAFNKELYIDADGYADIKPLVEIEASDISSVFTDESISENLFITVDDVAGLREFYKDMDLNNHIYLMRFDVNPYYCPSVTLTDDPWQNSLSDETTNGYYFEKAIYKDFDILSFTFKDAKNKVVTVPVSCDPVDIVGSVVPGPGGIDDPNNPKTEAPNVPTGCKLSDYKLPFRILIIVGGLFVFFFVVNLILKAFGKSISTVFEIFGAIIAAPFKGAAKLGKGIMSLTDRKLDRDIKKTNLENSKVKSSDQHEKHIDDIGLNHRREDRLGKLTDQRIRIEKQHEKSMKSDNYFKEEKVKEYKAAKTVKKEQSQKDKDVTDWFNQRINNTFGDGSSEKKK